MADKPLVSTDSLIRVELERDFSSTFAGIGLMFAISIASIIGMVSISNWDGRNLAGNLYFISVGGTFLIASQNVRSMLLFFLGLFILGIYLLLRKLAVPTGDVSILISLGLILICISGFAGALIGVLARMVFRVAQAGLDRWRQARDQAKLPEVGVRQGTK